MEYEGINEDKTSLGGLKTFLSTPRTYIGLAKIGLSTATRDPRVFTYLFYSGIAELSASAGCAMERKRRGIVSKLRFLEKLREGFAPIEVELVRGIYECYKLSREHEERHQN